MINFDPVTQDPQHTDSDYPGSVVPVVFKSFGSKLLGTMFLAAGEGPHPVVILLHGFPGNEVNFDLAHAIRRQGFNVLVFHYRGCWGSEGEFQWSNIVEDVSSAIEFLQNDIAKEKYRTDGNRVILIGYSMGGFAALLSAVRSNEIQSTAFIAGFNTGIFGELIEKNKEIYAYSVNTIIPAMDFVHRSSPEILLNEMITNKKDWNLINHIEQLSQKNLLIIGAKYDTTAPIDIHHKPLVSSLKMIGAPKLKEYILDTGHSFSDKRIKLARIISNWLSEINF